MLSLAAFRYRNVLAVNGGPIARIETGVCTVRGRQMIQANATLTTGLVQKKPQTIYSNADGTGSHAVAGIARHMAISEALERWAYYSTVRSSRAGEFGFEADPSSNGMSAFPGMFRRDARRKAVLEAVERYCLISWWEGLAEGHEVATDWPGVSAVAINGPFGGVSVVAYARTQWGGYVYGYGAEESVGAACERAVVELARHDMVLRAWWLSFVAGDKTLPTGLFERRCLFFASEEGYQIFRERLARPAQRALARPEVVCDCEIPGPWSEYATVWRFALQPPSREFLQPDERYFFW